MKLIPDDVLTIVTKEDRVTQKIYTQAIFSICSTLWEKPKAWRGIKSIRVLNRHAYQGMVFEGGEKECLKMGQITSDQLDIFILGITHAGRE
ncbi:hypothetical protein QN363_02945 [Undibacterium sp. CCC2.1]|nr:hypothetical protein [Undibacterium sp. CCC2.1]MEB0170690.1 hypothetical protein [Undibacterium sp. CCC1.1]MEB0177031.1 hypothetical protein [Undibacterium sp. CCC3.4]